MHGDHRVGAPVCLLGNAHMIKARPTEELRVESPARDGGAGLRQSLREWWRSLWTTEHQDEPPLPSTLWDDMQ